jgi:hypothetical protein
MEKQTIKHTLKGEKKSKYHNPNEFKLSTFPLHDFQVINPIMKTHWALQDISST